eukprot:gene17477-12500_t
MDKRARLLALNAFEQKQANRLNSSLKTRNAAMGQPDPELIAVASGNNDVARTPEQMRAEVEARLGRFFKPHISTQIMRHRWLTAANIGDLLDVWYPIVEPHLRNLTGRRAEVRIEDIIAVFRVAVAQVPKTPASPGVNPGAPSLNPPPAGPPPPPPPAPVSTYVPSAPLPAAQPSPATPSPQDAQDRLAQMMLQLAQWRALSAPPPLATSAAPPSSPVAPREKLTAAAAPVPSVPARAALPPSSAPSLVPLHPPPPVDPAAAATAVPASPPASGDPAAGPAPAATAAPLTPASTRSNFWTRPRTLDPRSPAGAAFATLVARAQVRYQYSVLWGQPFVAEDRASISAKGSAHRNLAERFVSNKKEVIKTTNAASMLETSYAVYGYDRLIVPTDDFFNQQLDAWYANGPRRDHLARYCDEDRSSPIYRGIDIPPVSVNKSPLPLATATATAAPAPDDPPDDVASVVAKLFDDDTVDAASLPAAAAIEGPRHRLRA